MKDAFFVCLFCFICVLLRTGNGQLLNIVDVNKIEEGKTFYITCDSRRVTFPADQPHITRISSLYIYKGRPSDTFNLLAQYLVGGPPNERQIMNIPAGRDWVVDFTGANFGVLNSGTMKLEIMVRDTKCSDAGTYRCLVKYIKFFEIEDSVSTDQNVTSTATIRPPTLILDPLSNAPPGWTNQSTYNLNARVTITCSTEGPPDLVFKWTREVKPASWAGILYEDYPNEADILTEKSALFDNCPKFSYKSTLRFTISKNDNNRKYRCIVQSADEVTQVASAVVNLFDVPPDDATAYTFVCDASQVLFPDADDNATDIYSMTVDFIRNGANTYTKLAVYTTFGPPDLREFKNVPQGRDWVITFSGANNGIENRNTMSIRILIPDMICADSGMYRCVIHYFREPYGSNTLFKHKNLTEAKVSDCDNWSPSIQLQPQLLVLPPVLVVLLDHFVR